MDTSTTPALAPRDLLILSVLSEGPLHGYGIVRSVDVRSESGVRLDPANLYRSLRRMRRDGWVGEAEEAADDGPRKVFALTPVGESVLRAEVTRLERLLRHVRPGLADGPLEGRS
jgi:DNA-binding PadR family transcriptional regulator